MIDLNRKIGILGGGQLGRMLIEAASPLGLEIKVLDIDLSYPAAGICPHFYKGDFTDYHDVVSFGQDVDILTVEIESVNVEGIKYLEQQGLAVYPQSKVLDIIVDKGKQKQFYKEHGFPTSDFTLAEGKEHILTLVKSGDIAIPFVQKIRVGGYDGRGVHIVRSESDLSGLLEGPSVIEKLIGITKEIAVIAARSVSGEVKVFPVVEMEFHPTANLVEYLFCPSDIPDVLKTSAESIAETLIMKMDAVGLLAVEMFVDAEGNLLVNESAPRPHNSGHHSIEACVTSQFEQHLRAILDLPLGDTKLLTPSVMTNVLGEESYSGPAIYEGLIEILKMDGVYPHIYGKKITKPFRKMGHVTIIDSDLRIAKEKAKEVNKLLKVKA